MSRSVCAAPPTLLALAALTIAAVACATTSENSVLPADVQYQGAMRAFEDRDYPEAIQIFQAFSLNYPQDPRIVDARWFTAEAYYRSEDWATAAQEYLNFQRDYSREARADDALYQAARSYQEISLRPELDQTETQRAINVYERLLNEYAGSEFTDEARERRARLRNKLAEKVYLNAEFYFDNEDYRAAEIYLDDLIGNYTDSDWLAAGYALLVETYCAQGLAEEASEVYVRLRGLFPESAANQQVGEELPESCRQESPPAASAERDSESR